MRLDRARECNHEPCGFRQFKRSQKDNLRYIAVWPQKFEIDTGKWHVYTVNRYTGRNNNRHWFCCPMHHEQLLQDNERIGQEEVDEVMWLNAYLDIWERL